MLKISQLRSGYSAVPVLKDIDVVVEAGQFVSIIGPNGAGKSTLFKTISGTVAAMSGSIEFEGHDLLTIPPARRPHLGIAHVPEGRQVFASLTVRENLEMGAYTQAGQDNWARNIEQIYEWFPKLKEREDQLAGTLSGGEQQMVAIGRGLASSPKLLMLDEPSMGLAPAVADFIFDRLMDIRKAAGLTILLVEQRVAEALQFADHAYVLETGNIALEGDNETLRADDRVRQAYLGM
jgi:branched-chain amino acid transport system ATP-binding protein